MTSQFEASDPNFQSRVENSFDEQAIMHLIGASITRVEAGEVVIELPYRQDLCQQDGFIHAGISVNAA